MVQKQLMKFHFITFADKNYKQKQEKLVNHVKTFNEYESVLSYDYDWLKQTDFYKQNKFILDKPRGCGYWLWKPYIILDCLQSIPENDCCVYLDCGDVIKEGATNYFEHVLENESCLLLGGGYIQKDWTKRDCFHYMNCDSSVYYDVVQLEAGFQVWKNCQQSIEILEEQIKYGKDYRIITDSPNECGLPNYDGFVDHRHDQSILTNLAVKHSLPVDHPSHNTYKHARSYIICNVEI